MKQNFLHVNRDGLSKTVLLNIINKLEQCDETTSDIEKCEIINEIIDDLNDVIENHNNECGFTYNDILCCIDWLININSLQYVSNHFNNNQLNRLFNVITQLLKICVKSTDISFALRIFHKVISMRDVCTADTKFLLDLLQKNNESLLSLVNFIKGTSSLEEIMAVMQCYDTILDQLTNMDQLIIKQMDMCNALGEKLLKLFFSNYSINLKVSEKCLTDFYLSGFNVLRKIIIIQRDFSITHTSELLGLMRSFLNYGINEQNYLPVPQCVTISQQYTYNSLEEIDASSIDCDLGHNNVGKKSAKSHKLRAIEKNANDRSVNASRNFSLSPPQLIDTFLNDVMKSIECSLTTRVRLVSIELIGMVCRNLSRRLLYGYWHALFPADVYGETKNHLLYVSQYDPNVRCRSAALQVCCQLLYGSKGFLRQAEYNEKLCPTAFIPFSINLGHMIKAIYKNLMNIINTEVSTAVLIQALKCLAVLLQATILNKIDKKFLQEIVSDVKPFVYHRDVAIQVSALMVMEFILTSFKVTNDVIEMLDLSLDMNNKNIDKANEIEGSMNWLLLRICFNLERQNHITTSIRIESLQVLNGFINHIVLLAPHLSIISELLQMSLSDNKSDIRLYSGRCIEAIAFQINQIMMADGKGGQREVSITNEITTQYDCFWLLIVDEVIKHLNQNTNETITIKICLIDALSNIGAIMFERLPRTRQVKLLAFLTGLSSSESMEDALVRATSIRALAVYATFPSLENDLVFLENTIQLALCLVTDSNVAVRIKVFWSCGNLSDALINDNVTSTFCQGRNSNELLYRLINASIKACNDYDKVRCNAVRTLGNLMRLLNEEHFTTTTITRQLNWRQTFENAIIKLSDCIRSSGIAKVKWNTCYALSNLFKNQLIYNNNKVGFNWQDVLYPALCHILTNHANFKVRTNASIAITNIEERNYFGNYYEQFWSALLEALEQTNNLNNYLEYNHRDALHEQLCLAISHLLHCSSIDDYITLKSYLLKYLDTIRTIWLRVIGHIVPEKVEKLLLCSIMLKKRHDLAADTLSKEQKKSLIFLIEYFQVEQL